MLGRPKATSSGVFLYHCVEGEFSLLQQNSDLLTAFNWFDQAHPFKPRVICFTQNLLIKSKWLSARPAFGVAWWKLMFAGKIFKRADKKFYIWVPAGNGCWPVTGSSDSATVEKPPAWMTAADHTGFLFEEFWGSHSDEMRKNSARSTSQWWIRFWPALRLRCVVSPPFSWVLAWVGFSKRWLLGTLWHVRHYSRYVLKYPVAEEPPWHIHEGLQSFTNKCG